MLWPKATLRASWTSIDGRIETKGSNSRTYVGVWRVLPNRVSYILFFVFLWIWGVLLVTKNPYISRKNESASIWIYKYIYSFDFVLSYFTFIFIVICFLFGNSHAVWDFKKRKINLQTVQNKDFFMLTKIQSFCWKWYWVYIECTYTCVCMCMNINLLMQSCQHICKWNKHARTTSCI